MTSFTEKVEEECERVGEKLRLTRFEITLFSVRTELYSALYDNDDFNHSAFVAAMVYFFIPKCGEFATCKAAGVSCANVGNVIRILQESHKELKMETYNSVFGPYRARLFTNECFGCQEEMLEATNKLRKVFKLRVIDSCELRYCVLDDHI
jgi:hypothetical protein